MPTSTPRPNIENALSEVLSVILIVALVAVAASVVAVLSLSETRLEEIPPVYATISGQDCRVTVFHHAGSPLQKGNYAILVDGVDRTEEFTTAGGNPDVFNVGDTLVWQIPPESPPPQDVRLVYTGLTQGMFLISGKVFGIGMSPCGALVPPGAAFSADAASGAPPLTVSFSDQSTGRPASWLWDFGDGETSTDRNPVHTYMTAGTYTVSLTVANALGSGTETRIGYITIGAPSSVLSVRLNCQKPGAIQTGGYLQFRVSSPGSITINGTPYTLAAGDTVRLAIGSDGTGGLQIWNQVSAFSFDDVTLSVNGDYLNRGAVGSISVPGYSSLVSTLTLVVPVQNGQALLKIDGGNIINGQDNRKITISSLQPNSGGTMQLQDTMENRVNYEGGTSGYLIG